MLSFVIPVYNEEQTIHEVIERELGRRVDDVFEWFGERPMAAASIGQVHRATLHDGRAVAVKIQYPGIAEALESDLRNAGMIMRLARAIAIARAAYQKPSASHGCGSSCDTDSW